MFFFQTFNSVLLDVQGVELASTIDHVTLAEMDAVARVAGLDLLQVNIGMLYMVHIQNPASLQF